MTDDRAERLFEDMRERLLADTIEESARALLGDRMTDAAAASILPLIRLRAVLGLPLEADAAAVLAAVKALVAERDALRSRLEA